MRLTYAWIVMLLMWLPAMVAAQSYQYVDANGVQQITNKLSDVPVDQRTGNITKTDILIPTGPHAESLLQTKAELDQEYTELAEEAESLTSMAGMALAEDEFEAYTIKINQFNERKADYEHRVKEFQEQIDALQQQQVTEDVTSAKTESQKAALAENLIKAKAELDKEHSDLMKEREIIVAEGQNPDVFSTTETFEAYRQKVADFNERKNDYERRAKEYQEKAEAHNKSLK